MKTCRLIMADQLSHSVSSLSDIDSDNDIIWMCEVWDEATHIKHHKKKIAFLFSAMRHFADELKEKGYTVHYTKLDDGNDATSFTGEMKRAIKEHGVQRIIVTEPSEYRVLKEVQSWSSDLNVDVEIRDDDRFLATHDEFEKWADGRKQMRMEYFYREMRRKHNILMNVDKPEGGEWNYDSQNRKPAKDDMDIPKTYTAQTDDITNEVIQLVSDKFGDHFGDVEPFYFAVTRDQALYALNKFIEERLINFGDYQDAMIEGEPWMYHSHLSFYINCGLLLPLECIQAAEHAYKENKAPINAVEGFIRQILGWREFIRGIYWLKMPNYETDNFLDATRKLPNLFWGGETQMNCMRNCVNETKENAYAHHIQRLMVLGNFSLLAGLHPDEVNEWYHIVYADAYQWVELPNVTGMILFADGGVVGSKPYAASGSYINKMSDYCKGCKYSPSKKNGEGACPFNYLYWDFLDRNEGKLRGNPRLNMVYSSFDRMSDEKKTAVRDDAKRFFKKLDNGEIV